jgi:hypothetical protein
MCVPLFRTCRPKRGGGLFRHFASHSSNPVPSKQYTSDNIAGTSLQIPFHIPIPMTSLNECPLPDFIPIHLCFKVTITKPFIPPGVPSREGGGRLHVLGFMEAISKPPDNFITRKSSTRIGNIFCRTKCAPKLGRDTIMLYRKCTCLSNGFNLLILLVLHHTLKLTVYKWIRTDLTTSIRTGDEKRYTNRPRAS